MLAWVLAPANGNLVCLFIARQGVGQKAGGAKAPQQFIQGLGLGFVDGINKDAVPLCIGFVGEPRRHLQALTCSGGLYHVKADPGHLPARSMR